MYKTGKEEKDLISALETLTELTGLDRVVHSGQQFQVKGEMSGGILKWSLEASSEGFSSKGEEQKGKGLPGLLNALDGLNCEFKADESILVLSLEDAAIAKNYDGTIHTVWYAIDPCGIGIDGEDIKIDPNEGKAYLAYPIIEMDLTESEYKACGTKLAFYDEFHDVLYPIQECAERGISSFLDCACVFKYRRSPLVSASFLAERLADRFNSNRPVKFLYRKRTERVRPLVSIVGKNHVLLNQDKLMKEACRYMSSKSIMRLDSWTITDEMTTATFRIDAGNACWFPEIELKISDMAGNALSASAYIRMGKGRILLKRNTSIHWSCFEKRGGVASLFEGLFEEIGEFGNAWDSCCDTEVPFCRDMVSGYEKILGKKRFAKLELPEDGFYPVSDLMTDIVSQTNVRLNLRWENELLAKNRELFQRLAEAANDVQEQALTPAAV